VQAALFHIEVFHQATPLQNRSQVSLRWKDWQCVQTVEDAVLAFQQIAGTQQPHLRFLLELESRVLPCLAKNLVNCLCRSQTLSV